MVKVTNYELAHKMEVLLRHQREMRGDIRAAKQNFMQLHVRFRQLAAGERDHTRELREIGKLRDLLSMEMTALRNDLKNMRRRYLRAVQNDTEVIETKPWWKIW